MNSRTTFLLVALLLLPVTPLRSQCVRFGFSREPVVTNGVAGAVAITSIDVNRDTRPDLILAGKSGAHLLLNAGSGRFAAPKVLAPGAASGVAAGDFNRDGNADVVVSFDSGGDNIRTFVGDGRGNFAAGIALQAGDGVTALAAEDLDADADLDLIAAERTSKSLIVFKGDPTGAFTESQRLVITGAQTLDHIALADLNGDGAGDVVTSDDRRRIAVALNDRKGQFGGVNGWDGAGALQLVGDVAAGDVDFDGRIDLLVMSNFAPTVYRGRGDGTFDARTAFDAGSFAPYRFFFRDVNADRRTDLLIADRTIGVQLFLNDPNGSYLSRPLAPDLLDVSGILTRDFDRDSLSDVLILAEGGAVSLFRGECRTRHRPVKR